MRWRTIIVGTALAAPALVNDQMLWLSPLTFTALAIAGIAAFPVRLADFMVSAPLGADLEENGVSGAVAR